ncbi:MAG: HlyD family efflux transporter periplasmic adaptor subunit [Phycisphaeraceae bacterium]|nr:HlyD family efflux transporter periplasmic adaptor subunit [Phycisphaeraceae bacterium]
MTQAQTQNRLSRGWSGMVAAITGAPSAGAFQVAMLDLQCKIVAAEYGAMWAMGGEGKPQMICAWPEQLADPAAQTAVLELLQQSAKGGFERQASHVLKVAPEGQEDQPGIGAHVFVTVLRSQGQVAGLTTVVADCRDPKVLQTTLPMRELGAGLYEVFHARQALEAGAREVAHSRRAMAMLATSQEAEGFEGAGMNLVNELARQLKCMRVSLGWIRGRAVRVRAMSDTEDIKSHSEHIKAIELAMGECLDQQQPVVCPPFAGAEPILAEAVVYAHKKLIEASGCRHVLSIPLRVKEEWLGAITLERVDEPFDALMVNQLQLVADVVSPHLLDRFQSDRWLSRHAWDSVKWLGSYLVGPKHVGWKLLGVLIFIGLLVAAIGSMPYRVSAEFTLEAQSRRIVPAPYQGDLADVMVRPGDTIKAGDTLARLNATELKLQRAEAYSQLKVYTLQAQKARAERKIADEQQATASLDQVRAKLQLLDYQIEKSTIRSPIDGVVLSGDWVDKIGGVVNQGDPMFEVAPLLDLRAVLKIPEADIDQIENHIAIHHEMPKGILATRSQPDQGFLFRVQQIVPMAGPISGQNVFQIRSALGDESWSDVKTYERNESVTLDGERWRAVAVSGPGTKLGAVRPGVDEEVWVRANWLRPGMEGLARIDVGWRPIWWVATHKVTETLDLWLWW